MEQLRTLLWLKTRLTFALYKKRKSLLASLLLTVPMTLAFNLGLYFAGLVAFWSLPLDMSRQILNLALTAIYVMWLLGPLLGVALNESYDLSKLLHFPVSGRTIFLANILGSIMDIPVLLLMVPLASIPVALAANALAWVLMALVLLLFLFHTISLSQALLTLMWGLLRSRRVADFWKVLVGLAGTLFYIFYQVAIRRMDRLMPSVLMARPANYTRFLPSGLAADAVMALHMGDAAGFAWRAAILAALCAATVALAGNIVHRATSGELILDRVGVKPVHNGHKANGRTNGKTRTAPAVFSRLLSSPTAAMLQKELWTLWRDPQAKVEILQRAGILIAWPIMMFSSPRSGLSLDEVRSAGAYLFLAPMSILALVMLFTASNVLARDRNGLSLLFTMPTPRRSIFHGKNLALLILFSPLSLLIVVAIAFMTRRWDLTLPAFVMTESLMLMTLGAGNLFSVYNPYALPEKGRNPYTSGQAGCMGCLGVSLGTLAIMVLAGPVALAFLAPLLWLSPVWFLVTTPVSVLYTVVLYSIATGWAARALTDREPEILQAILKTPA